MYDKFSMQALTGLHRYRDVKFSPPFLVEDIAVSHSSSRRVSGPQQLV